MAALYRVTMRGNFPPGSVDARLSQRGFYVEAFSEEDACMLIRRKFRFPDSVMLQAEWYEDVREEEDL